MGLSEICSGLDYVILSIPGDTIFFSNDNHVVFTPNFIYVQNVFGIASFDRSGQFLQLVCNNTTDHLQDGVGNHVPTYSSMMMKTYVGNVGNISTVGNKLFYQHNDNPNYTNQLITYEPDLSAPSISNPAISSEISGNSYLGNPVVNFRNSFFIKILYLLDEGVIF